MTEGTIDHANANASADPTNTEASTEKLFTEPLGFDPFLTTALDEAAGMDLLYKVDSRFLHNVTHERVQSAKTIEDLVPASSTDYVETIESIEVGILTSEGKIVETTKGDRFNAAQIELLKSVGHSANIYVEADIKSKHAHTEQLMDNYFAYYMTVVPQKEAAYKEGYFSLINYLKENSRQETAVIDRDELKPGQVSFVVSKKGTVTDVNLDSTSGYPSVDEKLVELIKNMPGEWIPATNAQGENVEQELVFFFGMDGC